MTLNHLVWKKVTISHAFNPFIVYIFFKNKKIYRVTELSKINQIVSLDYHYYVEWKPSKMMALALLEKNLL